MTPRQGRPPLVGAVAVTTKPKATPAAAPQPPPSGPAPSPAPSDQALGTPKTKAPPAPFHAVSKKRHHPGKGSRRGHAGRLGTWAGVLLLAVAVLGAAQGALLALGVLEYETPGQSSGSGTGLLAGRVMDTDGAPVLEATVAIDGTSHATKTNADGWYRIPGIPAGDYTVRATKPGFGTTVQEIRIESAYPRYVDFVLTAGGGETRRDLRPAVPTVDLRASGRTWVVVVVGMSIAAGVGGILAINRRLFPVPVLGATLGIMTEGFLLGALLGIIALALLFRARPEFVGRPVVRLTAADEEDLLLAEEATATRETGAVVGVQEYAPLPTPERQGLGDLEVSEYASVDVLEEQEVEPVARIGTRERTAPRVDETEVPSRPGTADELPSDETTTAPAARVEERMERALKDSLAKDHGKGDIVADVLKRLQLEAPAPPATGKVAGKKPRRPLAAESAALCRVCVRPLVATMDTYQCACGAVLHKSCAEETGRCPACGAGVPFDI